jgi:hypothetical protein
METFDKHWKNIVQHKVHLPFTAITFKLYNSSVGQTTLLKAG